MADTRDFKQCYAISTGNYGIRLDEGEEEKMSGDREDPSREEG